MRSHRSCYRLAVAALLFAFACADPATDVTAPIAEPEQPTPRPSLPALMVSDARVVSGSAAASSTADAQITYLALAPGSLPNVEALGVRNLDGTGPAVTIRVIDGGFDPVAVSAAAGDELELTLKHVSGTLATAYARVPAKRPPVIVRTFPTKGRTDVALGIIPTVIFSEPVDARTLAAGVRLFRGEEEMAATVSASPLQPWRVELTPGAELEPGTTYVLRVASAVRDLDGDSVEAELRVPFATAAAPPAPPPPELPSLPVPDSRIAFVSTRDGSWQLYVANADGSDAVAIRDAGTGPSGAAGCLVNTPNFPSMSPDGTRVIFVPEWMGPAGACLIAADRSSERPLPFYGPGSWSPDGTRILHSGPGGDNDVYTINSDGTGARRILDLDSLPGLEPLPPNHYRSVNAEWLPGGAIALSIDGWLWSMREDGSDVRTLDAWIPGGSHDWSPDGTRIAFVSYEASRNVLGSTAADGTDVRIHVTTTDTVSDPEWSPDGRFIAFVRQLGANRMRIFVVDTESGVVAPLLPDIADREYSDWDISWAEGIR